jgi:hypothetical protein
MNFFRIASDGAKGRRPRRLSEPSADEEDLQVAVALRLLPEIQNPRKKNVEKTKKLK